MTVAGPSAGPHQNIAAECASGCLGPTRSQAVRASRARELKTGVRMISSSLPLHPLSRSRLTPQSRSFASFCRMILSLLLALTQQPIDGLDAYVAQAMKDWRVPG